MQNSITFPRYSIRKLYTLLDEGRFAVPKLQRAFVWNGSKAAQLIDSIYREMPIGSVTIWDTGTTNRSQLRPTLHLLPTFDEKHRRVWFVLDGQQRLSVLNQIRTAG